ncbi:MAG: hypothetical protein JST39_07825 [Bacteroidetes bacterium]|nr:hypothetical protein [Bacteroidota bacterium]
MPYDREITVIIESLQKVEGYLACERIIIQNIKKQADCGLDDKRIEDYLLGLSAHLDQKMVEESRRNAESTNLKYASGFLSIVLKTPSWSSWVKTIEI